MDSLKDLLTSIKRSTLDQTDLDEKLVSGVKNFSRNKTVQGIGKAAFNTAAPSLNLVRQIGQTPQYQSAFNASANQLKNQVTQGIPAMYRLTDFVNPQQPFTFGGINGIRSSQRILQNPQQFASDITKAGSLAATAYGAPKLTPQLMGVSGLLGGAFNRFGGGSFSEGFGKGVAVSPQIAGITRLTNPVINSTANRFSSQFNNPLTRSLTGRGATGALNVPEGMAIDASLGQPTTLGSMGIDFASGFATGRTGTGGKVRLRPSKGLGMAKNQYEYMKPEHKDDVGKLIENLIFKGEDLNYNIQNKSKIEDQLRMYAEMYINKDFAWGTRKAGKGRNAQQIYKTSLQDVAQELMNRIRSENEVPDLFLPQLPFAAKNQTKVANAGLSDVSKIRAEYPDSTNNPLYQEMRKAQDTLMAKLEPLRGKYKTDAEIPAPLKKELDTLKADWQSKAKTWEDVYVNKQDVGAGMTPEQARAEFNKSWQQSYGNRPATTKSLTELDKTNFIKHGRIPEGFTQADMVQATQSRVAQPSSSNAGLSDIASQPDWNMIHRNANEIHGQRTLQTLKELGLKLDSDGYVTLYRGSKGGNEVRAGSYLTTSPDVAKNYGKVSTIRVRPDEIVDSGDLQLDKASGRSFTTIRPLVKNGDKFVSPVAQPSSPNAGLSDVAQGEQFIPTTIKDKGIEKAGATIHPDSEGTYASLNVMLNKDVQRKGLGTKIVKDLENQLSQKGIKTIEIDAYPESIGFWKKQGYEPLADYGAGEMMPMGKTLRVAQPSKVDIKPSVYDEVVKSSPIDPNFKSGFEYYDSLPQQPKGKSATVKIIGNNPSPNDMILNTDKGAFQRNNQTRYKKVPVKVLTENVAGRKRYKVVDKTGETLDTYDGELPKEEVISILRSKGAEFIDNPRLLDNSNIKSSFPTGIEGGNKLINSSNINNVGQGVEGGGSTKLNSFPQDASRVIPTSDSFPSTVKTNLSSKHGAIISSRVAPSKVDTELPEGALGFANISSEGTKMRSGKIKVRNFPTQTEVKNRAELNAGNPDLYTQRGQKIDEMFGKSEPLPWETNVAPRSTSKLGTEGQLKQGNQFQDPLLSRQQIDEGLSSKATMQELSQAKKQKTTQSSNRLSNDSYDDIIRRSDLNVKDKVAIWDYIRTPDRVFKKIGLEKEVKLLRQKEDDYLQELPKNIDKITAWADRVPSKESSQNIFRHLDGQKVNLSPEEKQVAKEVKAWLKEWADRLELPEDSRITNYITHIFEKDFIQKEFDPEIAKLIRDRVPGSVYDPFVEQRLGKAGYIEDAWRALDAYVKRATRKVHMDEALEQVARKADNLEESQFNYVKGRLDRINMRPMQIDNLIDNGIKSVVGYKFGQRPVASLSKGARQMVYRATLGLNPGTALKNLTQGANTYAKLGEKYTFKGYSKLVKNFNSSELEDVGILKKDMIQDRSYHATRKFWEKMDKGLFAFFELAEKINRGAAYYGAKAKALDSGATEKEAIEAGKKMVRDTQFTFGAVDTPAVLQSDIGKTLGQFQSFTLKQGEFLTEMAKNKEYLGLLRWAGASLGMVYTVGELIGMEPADLIPSVRIGTPPTLQLPAEVAGAVMDTPDKYGNDRDLGDKLGDIGNSALLFAPGSTQFKKTFEGVRDVSRGYSTNDYGIKGIINTVRGKEGKVRFPVDQTPSNFIRGALFGTNNLPEANEYYDNERTPLGENQSSLFKGATDKVGLYAKLIGNRESGREIDEAKEQVKSEGGAQTVGETIIYFDEDSGEARTLDLSKFSKEQSGIAKYEMQKEKYETARKAYGASGLTDEQKQQVYKATGVTGEDAEYDYIATKESAIKAGFLNESLASEDHNAVIEALTAFRKPSVSGQIVANDKTLDLLADEGLITSAEAKALKRIDYDSKGNLKASGSGGSKKAPPVFKLTSSQTQLSAPFSGGGSNFTVKTPSMTSSSIGSTKVPRLRLTPSKSSEDTKKLRLAIQNSNLSAPRLTFTRK